MKTCDTCVRRTERPDEQKQKLINRLNRIEGQVRGRRRMMWEDAYCGDVLTQSAAVAAAVAALEREILRSHVRSCVARDIREGREQAADELIGIMEKMMR